MNRSILRIVTKDPVGTIESKMYPFSSILSLAASLRIKQALDGTKSEPVEYEEYMLKIYLQGNTEDEFDFLVDDSYELEIRDEDGAVLINTKDLYHLEQAFMIAYMCSTNKRETAIKALTGK